MCMATLWVAGIIVLQFHATHVRQRGERLQLEVLKLTPGVTTLDEVRTFVSRTERPEGYAGFDGPCDESKCIVSIGPMAFVHYWHGPLSRPLGVFGIRPVDYGAIVEVRDGIVRTVDSSVFYRAAHMRSLSVSVVLVDHFSADDLKHLSVSKPHPAYALCGGAVLDASNDDQVGKVLQVWTATSETDERLTLNLSCVTSIRGCSDPSDLLELKNTPVPDVISSNTLPECPPQH